MTSTSMPTQLTPAGKVGRPATGEPIISCAGLTKVFRDFWLRNRVRAVDNIDLEIRRGEVFGLLGPNGSGKSTTIKMILGLLHPTAGRIAVFGKRPEDVATKKNIGYLPEESYLYPFLNARETLNYYGRLFHLSREQRQARIDGKPGKPGLLEMVGLEGVQRRPVGEYSKGMQRRIGLAQALINDPQLLILDEPTSGLDPIGTRQIKDLILELASRGKTVLLCSHLLGDVEDVCDRVAIMFGGKVQRQGTIDQLLVHQELTTLEIASLDPESIQMIEALLQTRGKHIERVQQPRQRLETLFLDIVHRAQVEGQATSGARSGGQLAEFLVTGSDEPGEVIERLVAPQPAPGATAPGALEDIQPPPAPTAALPDNALISELTKHTDPESAPSTEPAAPASEPVNEQEISDLLVKDWSWAQEGKAAAPKDPAPVAPVVTVAPVAPAPPAPVQPDPLPPPPVASVEPPAPAPEKAAAAASSGQPQGTPDGESPDESFIQALLSVQKEDPDQSPPGPAPSDGQAQTPPSEPGKAS